MPRRSRLLAAAFAAAALAASPAPASANLMSDCNTPFSTPVFAPWLDDTPYFLAPDGGFEAGAAGWDLQGAGVVAGNESYDLSGPGSASLRLRAGDSATSPAVCVGLEHPTFRFVVRRAAGSALSALDASVVMADGTTLPVGTTVGASSWQPSPIMLVGANLLPLALNGDSTQVRFRFTATSGTFDVDDVFVDPRGGN